MLKLIVFCHILLGSVLHLEAQHKVVGYITNHSYTPIRLNQITHLNIAFENPDSTGRLSFSTVNDRYIQEARANGVKVLVSLGGGGASHTPSLQQRYFSLLADSVRSSFVTHIMTYVDEHQFDGVDVDLEGPAINNDYGKFVRDLFSVLKSRGKLLTAALTHKNGADRIGDSTIQLFDFINIMAYDETGPWKPNLPGQHASMRFAKESLAYWTGRGLPKHKAILGVPFYGYGFGAAFNEGMAYRDIIEAYPGGEKRDVSGSTIYYNGMATIRKKTKLVRTKGYGGIMIWQLAQDTNDSRSLLTIINNVLTHN